MPSRHKSSVTHNLPSQPTPFIGRGQEITHILDLLRDPACRLLTLMGPGGIGKTRLALEAAAGLGGQFPDGVHFVPLQAVQTSEFVVSTIADAMDVTLSGPDAPRGQLLNYLRDRVTLLVLDNFEQLLPSSLPPADGGDKGAAVLLTDILQAAPGVKLLVTSREVLNLQKEWLFPVEGLVVPADPQSEGWQRADAVQLFAECARRVRWDFALKAEAEDVVRLCQLIEGMPLAIELAASWLKSLTCAEVAAEIQRGLDFLATTLRDVPERHRSMRAVFDHAWGRLTAEEQGVFMRLSVFRGGFLRAAAEAVAGATLPILTALVDKSLLRWQPDGRRYQVHELLRQFGEEQLSLTPEALAQARDRHATYYTAFLGDRFGDLTGARQCAALGEIGAELDNVRAAWAWAVGQRRIADLNYAAMALHTFYQYRGRFVEGVEAFAPAVAAVDEVPPSKERGRALAMLLTCAGWFEMRFGRVEEATHMQEKALSLYRAHNLSPPPGQGTDPLTALSLLAATRGEYEQAMALGQQARQRAADRSDSKNKAFACHGLASGALAQGDYQAALGYAQESLALARAVGNHWFMAYVYNQLGQINQALGDLTAAGNYFQASYTLKEELEDPEGMALALSHLGEIALARGAYGGANDLYQQSMTLYQKLGDRGGLVRTLHGLGVSAHRMGDEARARGHFEQALQVASEAQAVPLTLSLLVAIGTFLIESGSRERGLATLAFIERHPASEQTTRDRAQGLLRTHGAGESSATSSIAGRLDPELDLDVVITTLLAELSVTEAPADDVGPPMHQPLIDPLSERELEVLRLIAEGLANRQIAERLSVVLGTVKAHTSNIYSKLGVSNRTQAVARAQALKLL